MLDDLQSLLDFDQTHIWHPYTSLKDPLPVYPVRSAQGVRLTLETGEELIDGMSSWWAAIHGYSHPALVQALSSQAEKMSHVMFGGITHRPAVELAEKLVRMTPESLQYVFYSDSGSVSVEVAIKMAFQYWISQGKPERSSLLTVCGGYHGDTFQPMSVCDPVNGMHSVFSRVLPKHYFAPAPRPRFDEACTEDDLDALKAQIFSHHDHIAALILEPVVQGAGGMRFYSPDYLRRVRELCDENNILLIADEIATGFGRSGKLFACEHAGIEPDIMCVGKALTGGMMSMAATLANEKVARGISEGSLPVLMHGPTFMGNPLACSVANASLSLLEKTPWQKRVLAIEKQLREELAPCSFMPTVADVRALGAIGVVETHKAVDLARLQKFFVDKGVWIRPFGKLVYIMPPYIISPEDLSKLCAAVCEAVSDSRFFG